MILPIKLAITALIISAGINTKESNTDLDIGMFVIIPINSVPPISNKTTPITIVVINNTM